MTALPVTPPAARRLERFAALLRPEARGAEVLERVSAAYAPVWPLPLDEPELRALLRVVYLAVRYFKPRGVVQTGTFVGTSSIAMGLALEDNGAGRLYTIDPEPPAYFGVRQPVRVAREVAAASGLERRITFLRGYSTEPFDAGRMDLVDAPAWRLREAAAAAPCDLLVVDGDHTFFGCFLDLRHGAAALAPDGPRVVVVHDVVGIPDVRRAFRRWCAEQPRACVRTVPGRCGIGIVQLR